MSGIIAFNNNLRLKHAIFITVNIDLSIVNIIIHHKYLITYYPSLFSLIETVEHKTKRLTSPGTQYLFEET